jgi:hydroxyacylglutathione hydrolase
MIIIPLALGPLANNTYITADPQTRRADVIDPSFEPEVILQKAAQAGLQIEAVWLTHAHFDHIAGTAGLLAGLMPVPPVGLHPADLPLWRENGGARMFGYSIDAGPLPTLLLEHGQILSLGSSQVEVRHTPGHSPGHVVFYAAAVGVVFCGDLIFRRSVGRTDLPGSSTAQLAESIRSQIYTLPPEVRLLPGHGPETSVGEELADNPYV